MGIVDQNTCSALYNFSLTDRMLCAGFLEGRVDSCQVGDPGVAGGVDGTLDFTSTQGNPEGIPAGVLSVRPQSTGAGGAAQWGALA